MPKIENSFTIDFRDELFTSVPLFAKKHKIVAGTLYSVLRQTRSSNYIIETLLKAGMKRETILKYFEMRSDGEWVLRNNGGRKYR